MIRAGTPATIAWGGTSRVTTAPAATTASAPTRTGATSVAWAPMVAPRSTTVRSHRGARGNAARGWRTLVNAAAGPTKTSASSVTPSHTLVWLWMRAPRPTRAPAATKQNAPTTHPSPSSAPAATTALSTTRGAAIDGARRAIDGLSCAALAPLASPDDARAVGRDAAFDVSRLALDDAPATAPFFARVDFGIAPRWYPPGVVRSTDL